jgi:hypothetical protein
MRSLFPWVLCGLVCLSAPAAAAPNARLAEARRLIDDLELEAALKALDALEKTEGNDRATLLEVYQLQGIAFGTLGKDAKTRDCFRKLLMLAPDAKLPADLPPRVRTPFFEAKEWADTNGPLLPTLAAELVDGKVDAVSISVGKDVLRLAKTARFHLADQVLDVPFAGGRAQAPVGRAEVTWFVEVLNDRKAVLLTTDARTDGRGAQAATTTSDATSLSATPAPSGSWRRPLGFALLGAAAVSAGIGVVLGVQSAGARAQVTGATKTDTGLVTGLTQVEAAKLEAAANTQATVANVLFAVGGGLAAGGVVLVVLGPDSAPSLALRPTPGGLLISGAF